MRMKELTTKKKYPFLGQNKNHLSISYTINTCIIQNKDKNILINVPFKYYKFL